MKRLVAVGFFGVLSLAACGGGDDGGGGGKPGTANTSSATSAVTQVSSMNQQFAQENPDGNALAGSAFSLNSAAQTMVTPGAPTGSPGVTPAFVTGTCDCQGSTCTFDGCGDDSGQYAINGSISKTGDNVKWDLEIELNTSGLAGTWSTDGDLNVTDTSVDGSAHGSGNFSAQGQTLNMSWDLDINQLMLDASHCAIGGTMDATVNYGSAASTYSATVTFGPACGQAM